MRKKLLVLVGVLCLVAVLEATVQAATLRVGPDERFKNLQEAVMAANDFDTIRIEPGVYRSGKAILINGRRGLTIEGAGSDKVQLVVTDLRENVIAIKDCNGVRIANVSARHDPRANYAICAGFVIEVLSSANTTIVDCELNGCGSAGVAAINAQNINIIHNYIHHNSYAGLYLLRSTGLVQDNVIIDNNKAVERDDKSYGIVFKNNTFSMQNRYTAATPLDANDFNLMEIRLGETVAAVTAKQGNPLKTSRSQDGLAYDFGNIEVIFGRQNTVVNILTDARTVATRRGVRTGSMIGDVTAAYGENYVRTELDNLDLYEYSFSSVDKGQYILRFAVNRSTGMVQYIGCRAASMIETANIH